MATTQQGYLILADISGFTSYLAEVELDHAHEILSDLMEIIVRNLRSLLTISKLEGDAVFAYAPVENVHRGETLLELIEITYLGFRNRIEAIHSRTTCTCNACRNIPKLDLKFITHYGQFILQKVAGGQELLGSDVNLAHRLMKNHVSEATGWRAYALFSQPSLSQMQVWPEDAHQETETYEHLGDVPTYSFDLHARYQEMMQSHRVFLNPEEADVAFERTYPASPATLWIWLNDMELRGQWNLGTTWRAGLRSNGRMGVGSSNHCAHGSGESLEEILDWRPFTYFTTQDSLDKNKRFQLMTTTELNFLPDIQETKLNVQARMIKPRLPRFITRAMCRMMFKMAKVTEGYDKMGELIRNKQE